MLHYEVPQGSVLGPILFSLYTNPISSIIHSHSSINYHFYADDTQLYITLSPENFSHSIQKLKNCLNDIQNFMFANTVEPAKSNHPGENAKVVALCRWLLFAGSVIGVMSQSYVHSIPMCYKPNIYDIKEFLTLTSKSILYEEYDTLSYLLTNLYVN